QLSCLCQTAKPTLRIVYEKGKLKPKILRSAIISAAARYTALTLKIPSDTDDSWISAGNIVKFYPSKSKRYFNILKRIMKHFN
ncbi:Hypothetical protein FKW44_013949, partial [Caligus rogercresseyi]